MELMWGLNLEVYLNKFPEVVGLFWFDLIFGVFEANRDHQSKMSRN